MKPLWHHSIRLLLSNPMRLGPRPTLGRRGSGLETASSYEYCLEPNPVSYPAITRFQFTPCGEYLSNQRSHGAKPGWRGLKDASVRDCAAAINQCLRKSLADASGWDRHKSHLAGISRQPPITTRSVSEGSRRCISRREQNRRKRRSRNPSLTRRVGIGANSQLKH